MQAAIVSASNPTKGCEGSGTEDHLPSLRSLGRSVVLEVFAIARLGPFAWKNLCTQPCGGKNLVQSKFWRIVRYVGIPRENSLPKNAESTAQT
jgi:hypothetical protein